MAVTLIFASASFRCSSATAPTRSSPLTRMALLGPVSFHLAARANCLNAAGSAGTKTTRGPRPSGEPQERRGLVAAPPGGVRKGGPPPALLGPRPEKESAPLILSGARG